MKDFKHTHYHHPKGCGPLAMRQLSDASDSDVMSACVHNGYDPVHGGMTPTGFRAAALQLGIKLSTYSKPRAPMCLGDVAAISELGGKIGGLTFVVGIDEHVLVIKDGKVLDPNDSPPYTPVELIAWTTDGAMKGLDIPSRNAHI